MLISFLGGKGSQVQILSLRPMISRGWYFAVLLLSRIGNAAQVQHERRLPADLAAAHPTLEVA
jgi:hypothetical protein